LLQNEQVARAFSLFQMDVVNLSRLDLIYAQKLLARAGLKEREAELPVIKISSRQMRSSLQAWQRPRLT
jgi:hypothetical protein